MFEVTSEHGSYPHPVGTLLETGQVLMLTACLPHFPPLAEYSMGKCDNFLCSVQQPVDHRRSRDIFTEFNLLLKERRTGLRGLLDGRTEDGFLTREGIGALVTSLVSDIKATERQYFEVAAILPSDILHALIC